MTDDEIKLTTAYSLAALTMQMSLLNALAGQGGVPAQQINQLIARAKEAVALFGDPEFSQEIIGLAVTAIEKVGQSWQQMNVRH